MQNTKMILVTMSFAFVLSLTACGGGGAGSGSGSGGSGSLSASSFFKTGVGDTWTYSDTGSVIVSGKTTPTSGSATISYISFVNGVVTLSNTTTVNGSTVSLTGTLFLNSAGDLVNVANGVTVTVLPSAIAVGANWTAIAASGTAAAVLASITAMNVSRTVPAGTFNDCVEVTVGSYIANGTTVTRKYYMSPSVGEQVEGIETLLSATLTSTADLKLQSGYKAN